MITRTITSLLEEILLEAGSGVLTADNAYAALKVLAENSVDLVVTDIVMPGPSGIYLISEIQSKYPETKVIAISDGGRNKDDKASVDQNKYDKMYGDRKKEDRKMYFQKALEKGAVRCIEKPFRITAMVAIVKEVLGPSTP